MRLSRLLAGFVAAVLIATPTVAFASDPTEATECLRAKNVWVVVDQGNGTIEGGCATEFSNGLVALQSAGFNVTETNGFITKINDFPTTVTSDQSWLYWQRKRTGDYTFEDWKFSNFGATNSYVKAGSVEGWKFSNTAGTTQGTPPDFTPPDLYDPAEAICTASTKLADWADKRIDKMYSFQDPSQVALTLLTRVSLMSEPGPSYQKALDIFGDPAQYVQEEDSWGDPENDGNFAWKPSNAAIAALAVQVSGGNPKDVKGHNLVEIATSAVNKTTGKISGLYSSFDKAIFLISLHRIGGELTEPMINEFMKDYNSAGYFGSKSIGDTGMAAQLLTLLKDTNLARPTELAAMTTWLASQKQADGRYPVGQWARYFEQTGAAASVDILNGNDISQLRDWWIKLQLSDGGFPGVESGTGANIEASYFASSMLMDDTLATIDSVANVTCPSPTPPPPPVYVAPKITTQPVDTTVQEGVTAKFTVDYTGDPLPSVRWETSTDGTSWNEVVGWKNRTLQLYDVTLSQSGTKVRAIVTNPGGTVTSNVATLTVEPAVQVEIPDPMLSKCISDKLSISPATTQFTAGQLEQLTGDLFCSNKTYAKIKDLTGLEHLVNVTTLTLYGHEISDISVLAKMPQLTKVTLNNNPFTDLSGLKNLPNLETANLTSLKLDDLSPLATLPKLTTLNLNSSQYPSLAALAPENGVSPIKSLNVMRSPLASLAGVEKLTNLTSLNAHSTQVTDLSPLRNHPALTELFMNANSRPGSPVVTDVTPLSTIPTLTKLRLDYHGISDISSLKANDLNTRSIRSQRAVAAAVSAEKPVALPTVKDVEGTQVTLTNPKYAATADDPLTSITLTPNADGTVTYPKPGIYVWEWNVSAIDFSGKVTQPVTEKGPDYVITSQPEAVTAVEGSDAVFSFDYTGTPAPTITWQLKLADGDWQDVDPAAATVSPDGKQLTLTAQKAHNGAQVKAIIAATDFSAETDPAVLTVTPNYVITSQPVDATVFAGADASFQVGFTGEFEPTIQWFVSKDGGDTFTEANPDATVSADGKTLTYSAVTTAMNGWKVKVQISHGDTTVTSDTAVLTVEPKDEFTITSHPEDVTVKSGDLAEFKFAYTGSAQAEVTWMIDEGNGWVKLNPEVHNYALRENQLDIIPPLTMNGTKVKAVLTGVNNQVETEPASLTVLSRIKITANPAPLTLVTGTLGSFGFGYQSDTRVHHEWLMKAPNGQWEPLDPSWVNYGSTGTSLNLIPSMGLDQYQFKAVLTGPGETQETKPATLTVIPYWFTNYPTSTVMKAGHAYTFHFDYVGTPEPIVLWMTNEGNGWHIIDPGAVNFAVGHNSLTIIPTTNMHNTQMRVSLIGNNTISNSPTVNLYVV